MNDAAPQNAFSATLAFERTLTPGMPVEARWTNSNCAYRAAARVVRVNEKSVRVEITDPASYLYGRSIPVPLVMADTWSVNNCVVPA